MTSHVKSGNEILEEFFSGLSQLAGVDKDISDMLFDLYSRQKLTHRRLSDALLKLREDESDKDKNT